MSMATSKKLRDLEAIVFKQAEEIANLKNKVRELYALVLPVETSDVNPVKKAKSNGQRTNRRATATRNS